MKNELLLNFDQVHLEYIFLFSPLFCDKYKYCFSDENIVHELDKFRRMFPIYKSNKENRYIKDTSFLKG